MKVRIANSCELLMCTGEDSHNDMGDHGSDTTMSDHNSMGDHNSMDDHNSMEDHNSMGDHNKK